MVDWDEATAALEHRRQQVFAGRSTIGLVVPGCEVEVSDRTVLDFHIKVQLPSRCRVRVASAKVATILAQFCEELGLRMRLVERSTATTLKYSATLSSLEPFRTGPIVTGTSAVADALEEEDLMYWSPPVT
jgi:peroxiredoxin